MSIWTNWDPLEEVIVGNCPTRIPSKWDLPLGVKANFDQILYETKEDLDHLDSLLTNLGVKVHRPSLSNFDQEINLATFSVKNPVFPIVPRDQYFVYGNTIYQTYTSMPDRYLDSLNYYEIFTDLYNQGYNWISQPPPPLKNLNFLNNYGTFLIDGPKIYDDEYKDNILWHTATFFKCGDTLITNSKGPGTQLGLEWMKRNINDKVLHNYNTCMNSWGHIDHGFYMIDDDTVVCSNIEWVPVFLREKKIINLDIKEANYKEYWEENYAIKDRFSIDWLNHYLHDWKGYNQELAWETNVLVVDSKNVVCDSYKPEIVEKLEKHGITTHISVQRHGMFWEAGISCLTLDVKRKGEKRSVL